MSALFQRIYDRALASDGGPELICAEGRFNALELCAGALSLSTQLTELGLCASSGVLLNASSARDFITSILALLKLKAVSVPIVPSDELPTDYWVETIKPHWVLQFENSGSASQHGRPALTPVRRFDRNPFVPHVPDAAFVRMSSGTTGAPKGVVLSEKRAIERIETALHTLHLEAGDTVLWLLQMPYHFIVSVLLYLIKGINIYVPGRTGRRDFSATEYNAIYASPYEYDQLLNAAPPISPNPNLRLAYCTSGRLGPRLAAQFHQQLGIPLTQLFGIIEAGLVLENHANAVKQPLCSGRVAAGYEAAILSPQGDVLRPGEIGELGIQGPGMFDAYLNPPVLSCEMMRAGWFLSGDLARHTENGEYYVLGRRSSAFEYAGKLWVPEEVEAACEELSEIKYSRFCAPDSAGEAPMLEFVLKPKVDEIQIVNALVERLERIDPALRMVKFQKVPEIQRTTNGKIKRSSS